jgi:guanylate kinase
LSKIFALYGPSASGKSEIQQELTRSGLQKIITATTRPPRQNEQAGVHYIFMNDLQFEAHADANHFIEWTRYNGQYYGTLKSSIDEILNNNGSAHIVLDLSGVLSLKTMYPNTVVIYVGANIETIKRRLEARGSSPEEIVKRVKQAEEVELSSVYMQYADVVVWNHDGIDFTDTLMKIKEITALQ